MTASYRIVLHQAVVAAVIAVGLTPMGLDQSLAALLGGAVCVVPNAYFAWRAGVERSPARLLAQGVGKGLGTVVLMATVFVVVRPAPLGFFAAFIAMQWVFVAAAARRAP